MLANLVFFVKLAWHDKNSKVACASGKDSKVQPGPEVIKLFSCSAQLSMNFFLLLNVKMPTIVGILTFVSRKNSILGLSESDKRWISWYFYTYENLKFHAQLSWAWKKFYNLGAWASAQSHPCWHRGSLDPKLGGSLDPKLGGSLDPKLEGSLDPKLGGSLDPKLWDSLDPKLWDSLDSKLGGSLDPKLGGSLDPKLEGSLDPKLWDSLDPKLGGSLDPKLPIRCAVKSLIRLGGWPGSS